MSPDISFVHSPLARWAIERGQVLALDDGVCQLTFSQLHELVERHALDLNFRQAPKYVVVDVAASIIEQITAFLGINASGRCAVMLDPTWPDSITQQVGSWVSELNAIPDDGAWTDRSPFYLGFTSGSTGQPKGFRRDHRSWVRSFEACRRAFGQALERPLLAPGRVSHSLFLFGVLQALWLGSGAVVQDKFSVSAMLGSLGRGRTPCLIAVPSQLLMLMEHARRKGILPMSEVQLIMISGARWMRQCTPELRHLFPCADIIEFYGASETSFVAWMHADENVPAQVVGRPFDGVDIDIRPVSGEAKVSEVGQIFVRSAMVFMDHVGAPQDKTAAYREGDWLTVRDMGYLDHAGRLCLTGRQNRMIVTQGKNLFPEELETCLSSAPEVDAAAVIGVPDPVRGQTVVAVVKLSVEATACTAKYLTERCLDHLEPYKVPKRFFCATQWPVTTSGKTDFGCLERALAAKEVDWLHRMY